MRVPKLAQLRMAIIGQLRSIGETVGASKPSVHIFKFAVAGRAEFTQQIEGAVDSHLSQFDKTPVGFQIGIENFSRNFLGIVDYLRGRQNPHPAQFCVEADKTGNVGFIVLERVDVALRGLLDKILVEDLPTALFVIKPLGSDLAPMVDPIRNAAHQTADSCPGQGGDRRDN
jgi:hypothetical protein